MSAMSEYCSSSHAHLCPSNKDMKLKWKCTGTMPDHPTEKSIEFVQTMLSKIN